MATDAEQSLLFEARRHMLQVEAVRVVDDPAGRPGHSLVMIRTFDRQGHAVGGYSGAGIDAAGVVADNLVGMVRQATIELRDRVRFDPSRATD